MPSSALTFMQHLAIVSVVLMHCHNTPDAEDVTVDDALFMGLAVINDEW